MLIRRIGSSQGTSGDLFPAAVRVTAPAKINVFLEVLGKRTDGYHAIETVMLAVELFDDLIFTPDPSGEVALACDQPELTTGPDNLVIKAAHLLQERTDCRAGVKIALTKRIPWAAGLGGGSSDAASALAGLNELWKLGLPMRDLALIGSELGSDVPFFFDVPAALCTGRGEMVKPIPIGRAFDLVLVKPPTGLNTAAVYRELGAWGTKWRSVPHESVLDALAEGNVEKLGRCLHNRLQEPAMRLCPQVAELLERLRALGAAGTLMSGSGSCLFALCRDEREAERVATDLLSGLPPETELARTCVFPTRSCS